MEAFRNETLRKTVRPALAVAAFLGAVSPEIAKAQAQAEDGGEVNTEQAIESYKQFLALKIISNESTRNVVVESLANGLRESAGNPAALLSLISDLESLFSETKAFTEDVAIYVTNTTSYNNPTEEWTEAEKDAVAPIILLLYDAVQSTHEDFRALEKHLESLEQEISVAFPEESPDREQALDRVDVLQSKISELRVAAGEIVDNSEVIDEAQERFNEVNEADRVASTDVESESSTTPEAMSAADFYEFVNTHESSDLSPEIMRELINHDNPAAAMARFTNGFESHTGVPSDADDTEVLKVYDTLKQMIEGFMSDPAISKKMVETE